MKIRLNERVLKEKILNEMAQIGTTEDGYVVFVRSNDSGNIPHFHYFDAETFGDKFHSCIRLDSPAYFPHEGKDDVLNHKQRKNLVSCLKSPYRRFGITQWEHLLIEWNDNNEHANVDEDIDMPDYTLLK